jgi:hypothetical protein
MQKTIAKANIALFNVAALCLALASSTAFAQQGPYQEGYRYGFDAGFKEGYERALADIRARQQQEGVIVVPPGGNHIGGGHHGHNVAPQPRPHVKNRGIVVVNAAYGANEGRDRRSCDLTKQIYTQSIGKMQYDINVSNQLCGDPAPSVRKALRVTYMCGGEERVAEANEHRSLRLDCSQ